MDSIWADREGRHGDFRLLSVGELALDVRHSARLGGETGGSDWGGEVEKEANLILYFAPFFSYTINDNR